MGRELKRVPLDFDWPLKAIWKGYLSPYAYHKCPACDGDGYNPETKIIADAFYAHEGPGPRWCDNVTQDEVDALIEAGRLRHFNHETRKWETVPRTAAEVNAANARGTSPFIEMHHDGLNRCILIETRAKRLGVWGFCPFCDGHGNTVCDEKFRQLAEEWTNVEPPVGDGFQLWETTSEGSPASPVFETLDALCQWAAENATTFGSATATAEKWREMLDDGFVCHRDGPMIFV